MLTTEIQNKPIPTGTGTGFNMKIRRNFHSRKSVDEIEVNFNISQ
jgi:hypothetical protein